MWIHIFTILDGILDIQIDSKENISQLKKKLETLRGYPQVYQNFIFNGKELKDSQTIEELQLKNDNFLILFAKVKFI